MRGRRSTAAGVAAFATASLIVSCGSPLDGTAEPESIRATRITTATTTVPGHDYAWLTSVLPNSQELTAAAGSVVKLDGTPSIGVRLRNTAAGARKLTEEQCFGVISPFEEQVYDGSLVRALTYATEPPVSFGAAALDSPSEARKVFDAFAEKWLGCDGKTVVKDDGAYTYEHRISQVSAASEVLSAVDEVTSNSPVGAPVRSQRALGVASDCIVEVTVPITSAESRAPGATASDATDLVNAMLTRVRAVRP